MPHHDCPSPARRIRRGAPPAAALALLLAATATPAEAAPGAWSEELRRAWGAAEAATRTLAAEAEKAIVVGGVLLYRHRHAIAGAALGCAAGSLVGATSAVGAAPATGGASLSAAAPAAALGCGVGAVAGASLGRPLDQDSAAP